MKYVIGFANPKSGTGKTTLALNFSYLFANELKLKTLFVDYSNTVFETEFLLNQNQSFVFSDKKSIDDYFLSKEKFYLLWLNENNLKEALTYWLDKVDVILIDTQDILPEEILKISGKIIIPTVLEPLYINYIDFILNRLKEMKYPLNVVNILVNKNSNGLLKYEDIKEIFKDIKICGILPCEEEISKNGNVFVKNKKSVFFKNLFQMVQSLINNFPDKNYFDAISKLDKKSINFYSLPAEEKKDISEKNKTPITDKYSKIKKDIRKKLYDELDIKNLEKDALSQPDKRKKIYEDIKNKIRYVFDKSDIVITDIDERERVIEDIYNEVTGLGAIEDFIKDEGISEIMVNRHNQIYIERSGKLIKTDVTYTDNEMVLRAIEKIVLPIGRRIDESMPYVDARLPDGSRVNAIIPPLSLDGPVLTIRKF